MSNNGINSWSEIELEAAVDAYLQMLQLQDAGKALDRAAIRNSLLSGKLSTRSAASIEFRMQNISAYLDNHNLPRIKSYNPAKNMASQIQSKIMKSIDERIAEFSEYKRIFAKKALTDILKKYYNEPSTKIDPIIAVVLDALDHSDYGAVVQHIAEARKKDVAAIAESLSDFGLAELAFLAEQAKSRLIFLDNLEAISNNPKTLETEIHKSIENNLWIFGPTYSLFSSNKTLKSQIEHYTSKKYKGERASKRPDLLLNENLNGELLLIEFKRPLHKLCHDDYLQSITYRHEIQKNTNNRTKIIIIGGEISQNFPTDNREACIKPLTFNNVISTARRQIQWQLQKNHT
jgi:hypothetical protein